MLVILYEGLLVGVRVGVGLPVVAVFVLMLDVLVIVQDVRMGMGRIRMAVLVSVLRGHPYSVLGRFHSVRSPNHLRIDRAS